MKARVVAIVGPTAAGKSAVSVALAEQLGAEIVGADSIQVYRGFDIGSAKPTAGERARVPHHMIDVAEPDCDFTAADYARQGGAAIGDIAARGRLPLVVGGTGLYLRALFEGLMEAPGKDARLRDELLGIPTEELRRRLEIVDPAWAKRILGDDRVRLVRALEIHGVTGKPPSQWAAEQHREPRFEVLWVGLSDERPALYRRIDERVEAMWRAGWPAEVARLAHLGYADTRPMRSVGYAEVYRHVAEGMDERAALAAAKQRTRRYAKRQLTWFRANTAVHWFVSSRTGTVDEIRNLTSQWFQ